MLTLSSEHIGDAEKEIQRRRRVQCAIQLNLIAFYRCTDLIISHNRFGIYVNGVRVGVGVGVLSICDCHASEAKIE